jgi:serine/threonine protein kinase/tetratricopeptide (TPR) repeat protein
MSTDNSGPGSAAEGPTAWRLALPAFERLLSLDGPARIAALEALRAESPELYTQVRTLLRADQAAQTGPDMPTVESTPFDTPRPEQSLSEGDSVGLYRVEKSLGAGGMGEVWLAHRADGLFEAPVALKLLHVHLARSSARQRFVREGRILGQLTHSNVARLLDAGVLDDGQMYLAIEYVDGERIDHWCDERRLGIAERVQLFLQVCSAVAHAHAHLVVHRDLKPSNILVGTDGSVKLLDFGIAKLVEDEAGGAIETELTRLGGRAMTPEYAAPEQILGAPVTVATDVYSLGALLYALLSGHRPYGTPGDTAATLERAVLEYDPPPPSDPRRRRGADATVTGPYIADCRATTPARLRNILRGDLDTIVLKSLKKAPADRYASVPALANELRRWLDHEPIQARPDRYAYRASKFVRRHRLGVAAGTAVAAALIAGVAGTLWQSRAAIAAEQSERAQRLQLQAREAELSQVVDFQSAMLRRIDVQKLGLGWMEKMRANIAAKLAKDKPLGDAQAARLLADFDLAQPWSQPSEVARQSIGAFVLEPAQKEIGQRFDRPSNVQAALRLSVADAYEGLGLHDAALAEVTLAIAAVPGDAATRERLDARLLKSLILYKTGHYEEGLAEANAVVDERTRSLGAEHPDTLAARRRLVNVLQDSEDSDRALAEALALLETERRVLGEEDSGTLATESAIASLYSDKGDSPKSVALLQKLLAVQRRVLGVDDRSTLTTMMQLAGILADTDEKQAAKTIGEEALDISRRVNGEGHPLTLSILANLARAVDELGDKPQAFALKEEAYRLALRFQGDDSRLTQIITSNYAVSLDEQGRWDEALALFEGIAAVRTRTLGPDKAGTLHAQANVAAMLTEMGRYADAGARYADLLLRQRRILGADHRETLQTWRDSAVSLDRGGEPAAALKALDEMMPIYIRVHGADALETLVVQSNRGLALCHLRRYDEADAQLTATLERQRRLAGAQHPQTLDTLLALAQTRAGQHRPSDALALAREALAGQRVQLGSASLALLPTLKALAGYESASGNASAAASLRAEAAAIERRRPSSG